jgi:digeranylgeranylglycerophospholipid reductase
MYDVIVVGGGPVGSQTAYRLAEAGNNVLVLEAKKDLKGPVCCTGIISRECADTFGLDGQIVLRRASSARFFSPSGESISLGREDIEACVVDRPALDSLLAEKAMRAGARYLFDTPVHGLEITRENVCVTSGVNGKSVRYEALALVLACGPGAKITTEAGLKMPVEFACGAQAEVTSDVTQIEVYFGHKFAPGSFAWLVPSHPGRALVGLMTRRNPVSYLKKFVALLQEQQRISGIGEIRARIIPLQPLARTFGRRLVTVGSAAGQVKPITGGGIYFGLLCAEMAAITLNDAIKTGDLTARSLKGYEKAWRARLAGEIRRAYWARKIFEKLNDSQINILSRFVEKSGFDRTLGELPGLSFDWHGNLAVNFLKTRALSLWK